MGGLNQISVCKGTVPFALGPWDKPHVVSKSPEVGKFWTHVFVVCPTWTPLVFCWVERQKSTPNNIQLWFNIMCVLFLFFAALYHGRFLEPTCCWGIQELLLLFYGSVPNGIRLFVLRILDFFPCNPIWPGGWDWDKINPTNFREGIMAFRYGFSRISGRNHLLESHDGNPRIHGTKGTFTYMNTININQMYVNTPCMDPTGYIWAIMGDVRVVQKGKWANTLQTVFVCNWLLASYRMANEPTLCKQFLFDYTDRTAK